MHKHTVRSSSAGSWLSAKHADDLVHVGVKSVGNLTHTQICPKSVVMSVKAQNFTTRPFLKTTDRVNGPNGPLLIIPQLDASLALVPRLGQFHDVHIISQNDSQHPTGEQWKPRDRAETGRFPLNQELN